MEVGFNNTKKSLMPSRAKTSFLISFLRYLRCVRLLEPGLLPEHLNLVRVDVILTC
jgi:hypothetical protein